MSLLAVEVNFSMTALLVSRDAIFKLQLQRCAVHAVICVSHVVCFVCCAMLELWLAPAALHKRATRMLRESILS